MASPVHCRALASSTTAISSRGALISAVLSKQCTQNRLGSLIARRYKSGPYGYTQAKALVYSKYGEPADVLSLHNHSISPSLPSKSMLLRTLATPINPADINQIQGVYPSKPPFTSLLGTEAPSAVGGNEGCFEVMSLGPGISTLSKGDWVIMKSTGFGTWRTHAIAEESQVLKIGNKEGLKPIQVGTVSVNPCTAYRMLRDFESMVEGDWFIQNGANSGVGRAAIQLGKRWGYKSINIIRDRENAEETEAMKKELLELGATKVVTESELMDQRFRDQVKEWTNGGREKIRVGLNCVGGQPAGALVKCLSNGGHLVTY
ncbi:hypothetical protein BPOR_0098g00130 [Botrytis porri]|uniref:enoyl-[acyl-carrier-protein] reductase n=2 Tax=Botrytis porri TaxID=87229 RepID=A0A4Z1KYQ5_9HELO|nr:hypothetical protein BPOR_0098g00130 [Botrytis porri]